MKKLNARLILACAALCAGLHHLFAAPPLCLANVYEEAVKTHGNTKTFRTSAAMATPHVLVTFGADGKHIALAGATDVAIGTLMDDAPAGKTSPDAAEDPVTIKLFLSNETHKMVASEAMATVGVPVYQAAGGKVALSGTRRVGILHSTAAADGDLVEVQPLPALVNTATTIAATRTILASEMDGRTFFFGHATEFAMTLPAPFAGARGRFICTAAPSGASYTLVTASSANVIKGHVLSSDLNAASDSDSETSGGDTISFVDAKAVAGDWLELESDGTNWFARASSVAFDAITITTAS